jgi:hypothetical protein
VNLAAPYLLLLFSLDSYDFVELKSLDWLGFIVLSTINHDLNVLFPFLELQNQTKAKKIMLSFFYNRILNLLIKNGSILLSPQVYIINGKCL